MIRVVVAEDQGIVLDALAAMLALGPDVEVVGCAHDGLAAGALLQRERPDVLLSDIEMPAHTGLEPAARIQGERLPEHLLIVTTFGRPGYLRLALDASVSGYLLKDQLSEELAAAVRHRWPPAGEWWHRNWPRRPGETRRAAPGRSSP